MRIATALLLLIAAMFPAAQPAAPEVALVTLTVSETAGIRRTEYPVGARVELPRGALAAPADAALRLNGADVPAQFTVDTTWPDGSIRALQIDFNASIGPL